MIDYENELNKSQLAAVKYTEGPSLVIAGAGSGKTRVLTYKIAWLLENDYDPWRILALTFTNKAAAEMKERIARQVGADRARYLWMGTFHSIFARILRQEADVLGIPSTFTIYDQSDSRSLIRALIKEMGLDEKIYKVAMVQNRISAAKNVLVTASMYYGSAAFFTEDSRNRMPSIRDIYVRYSARCAKAGALDFDDLLMRTYYLFENHPEVLEKYRERFAFVMVDEYQDTNKAQHEIVWQLTKEHQRVCVVGDDSQSIYSFRGARIDNILGFQSLYDNPRLFKLEENYRSTQTIVNAANSLIYHNHNRIPKEVYSNKEKGEALTLFEAASDKEEAGYVVRQILALRRRKGLEYSDFAILYRTNAQSRTFEEELRKNGVDYRIYGGLSFYQRKEIKDVIAYFRVIANPHDEEAFKRIINYPARGIGETTLNKIAAAAERADVSLWDVANSPEKYSCDISRGTAAKVKAFCDMMEKFREEARTHDAYEVALDVVATSGIRAEINGDLSDEGRSRQENVQELLDGISDFVHEAREEGSDAIWLSDFLSNVALLTDQDEPYAENIPRVTLMTVHSAKGLEFDTVFVVGLENELFPSELAQSPAEIEEERRLLYVAITRAEKRCFLTWAKMRIHYGKPCFPFRSCFIGEIDTSCLTGSVSPSSSGFRSVFQSGSSFGGGERTHRMDDFPTHRLSARREASAGNREVSRNDDYPQVGKRVTPSSTRFTPRLVPINSELRASHGAQKVAVLSEGQRIEHERFGKGTVVSVEGTAENSKALIRFDNVGEKTLLLKFARFRVIEE
ncbi:MAG: UvrD-helicase domain-containing protein [Bacteroidaceae bacterium]|nr:UvrD-helicase domain-containing protein [Bacteroidaceae bacterium]